MALHVVLKNFNGLIVAGGKEWTPAGSILDDAVVNVAGLNAAGCPTMLWTASAAQVAALAAFVSRDPNQGPGIPSENLLDLLIAFGAFGAVGGTTVPEFTFRPTAADNPALGIYGSWASLSAAIAALAAAGLPYVVNIDLTVSAASFLIPTATSFGGQAILRGRPQNGAFTLQIQNPATVDGVLQIDGFLRVEAVGPVAAAAITLPAGASILIVGEGSSIVSNNALGSLIEVGVGQTLTVVLLEGGQILFGGVQVTIQVAGAGATLTLLAQSEGSRIADMSIGGAPGSTVSIVKMTPSAHIPHDLPSLFGYLGGGIGSSASFIGQQYSEPLAHFGVLNLPLIAGAYFLPYAGNAGVALATAVDQSYRQPPNWGGNHRLLSAMSIWAAIAGVGNVDVEVLVNGVLVPGMIVLATDLATLAATPVHLLATNPVLLADDDAVSIRVTVPGPGIGATPTDIFAVVSGN